MRARVKNEGSFSLNVTSVNQTVIVRNKPFRNGIRFLRRTQDRLYLSTFTQ